MASARTRYCRVGFSLLGLASCFVVTGCGPATGNLTGKVTYQGKALKGGNVTLVSTEGGPSYSGAIGDDGAYRVVDARAGTYKVCVDTSSLKPPPGSFNQGPGGAKKGGPVAMPSEDQIPPGYTPSSPNEASAVRNLKKYVQIPDSYAKTETTPLTYKFAGGEQTYDIEVK